MFLSWTSEVTWDPEADAPGAVQQLRRSARAPIALELDEFYEPYAELPRAAEGW